MAIKNITENVIDVSAASDRELLEYNCVMLAKLGGVTETMSRDMGINFKHQHDINVRFERDIEQLRSDVEAIKKRLPLRAM